MVRAMHEAFADWKGLVLAQGDAPRGRLVEAFRDHGNAILIGTLSIWRGVDVAGSALRLVVIDKLPFAHPSDPIQQGRVEYLRSQGLDAFRSFQVPQAALLLRQGFGRLLRHRDDRGIVAILGGRLLRKGYGRIFLRSLPPCPRVDSLDGVTEFFRAGDALRAEAVGATR